MKNDHFKWQKITSTDIKSKISEADILELFNQVTLRSTYPKQKLCLIIHPSRTQDIKDIMRSYRKDSGETHIATIYGMKVYPQSNCPINYMYIIPEFEFLDFDE